MLQLTALQSSSVVILCHLSSVVCLSFVTQVYCDKMIEARIMQISLNSMQMSHFEHSKFDNKI